MIEMRLTGSGGQGLITAGIILAEAALLDGKLAIQSQSYGPEARGGASKAEVIISEEPIHYPKVTSPNLVLAMHQEAANKYVQEIADGGVILIDSTMVKDVPAIPPTAKICRLPITGTARTELGTTLVANIIALGAVVAASQSVSKESIKQAVLHRVPKGTEELNLKALTIGMEMMEGSK
jgi:2-oxoglutarate ferredoxin oxidoreductase subunit gamma